EHEHVAVGRGQPRADAAGDLVAHTRVAVLHAVALRVAHAPELVQVTRHRACGAHDHVARRARLIHRADHRALRHRRVVDRVLLADLRVPLGMELLGYGAIALVDDPLRRGKGLETGPRITEERQG